MAITNNKATVLHIHVVALQKVIQSNIYPKMYNYKWVS